MYAEYDFTVNQDFTTVSKNLENGGRSIEYYITLDMANFHSPKLGRPPIPMNKMGKP